MRRRQLPGEPPPPTKSELKRQARSTQDLANRLIDAPAEIVAGLELPEKLADALELARRITRHGAALRQRQFVAKLMRGLDPEPIRLALEADAQASRQEAARFRRAERWRDRLIADRDAAIERFIAEFPAADAAALESLVAAAVAEPGAAKPAGARRALFRWVQKQF
ncbi:MAG TPA: ribosome biogenesis factor YjgA [Steroidobacteraceae bacterium]|nr:ribosome biogenesis factor YjgA [Steroidobacteraceae bacterium]